MPNDDVGYISEPGLSSGFVAADEAPLAFGQSSLTKIMKIPVMSEPKGRSKNTNKVRPGNKNNKAIKPRILCPQCKLTFPRRYELDRHTETIHHRKFRVNCHIHGCRRSTKPFTRQDKVNEHLRKHSDAVEFLCPLDDCTAGPFDRLQLRDHLGTVHDLKSCNQQQLDSTTNALSLSVIKRGDLIVQVEHHGACPLLFTGCTFEGMWDEVNEHLKDHDLIERSEGIEAISKSAREWWMGKATCPVCREKNYWLNSLGDVDHILYHLLKHTSEERIPYAADIFQMLRPWTIDKIPFYKDETMRKKNPYHIILQEIEGAGLLPPEGASG
jgi:hypothetical protein